MEMTEMKTAAELNAQTPPPFVASQSGIAPSPTANEEAQLRALFQEAVSQGKELNDLVTVPAPAAPAPAQVVPVPEKFKTPEGTVDEEKLKASSKQLDTAIEQKQKSIEEIMADYKAREKKLHELSQQKSTLEKQLPEITSAPVVPSQNDPALAQMHQQIMADMQRDPVGTSIMLNKALVQKELEPILARFRQEEEVRMDGVKREGLAQIAQADPRILNAQYYSVVNQILDEDPGLMKSKNPYKAAWNEAKERLRLGEPQAPAQPSTPSPTLGRGAPPSVSTFQGSVTPQSLSQQVNAVNPYTDEGREFERRLREATNGLWQ